MREELNRLLNESPESETRFIRNLGIDAYDFLNEKSLAIQGLIIDGRPIYIAAILQGKEDRYIFWTIVNSNINNKIDLCRESKKQLKEWLERFVIIYATMYKGNIVNQKWTEWLGFIKLSEDEDTITYKLGA